MKAKHPVILIIRDGWGYRANPTGNYIAQAKPKNFLHYWKNCPHALLKASGEAVGLLPGYQGNSEVGHLTIGSGRIVYQSLPRITRAIADRSFFKNKALIKTIEHCQKHDSALHLIGLLQTQGVHSHLDHLMALLELCRLKKFNRVFVHVITDGRDAPPTESLKHIKKLKSRLKQLGFGRIASVSGRYYAMDRNKRWERTRQAYDCLLGTSKLTFEEAEAAVKLCHNKGQTDEFIKPMRQADFAGIKSQDGVIFFNFRTDRPRQLTQALIEPKFSGFKRKLLPLQFTAMTQYYEPLPAEVAFPNLPLKNLLGEIVARSGMKQLRISETEKYAHVTFFFNGQNEKPNRDEDRILIKSPHLPTYDLKPEMSVYLIADRLKKEIKKKKYDLIVVNLVNCDMVGHTANKAAIIKAVRSVDDATGQIAECGLEHGYTSLIVSDHGNAEDKTAKWATSHTINPVPLILISDDQNLKIALPKNGGLKDVAPLILKILNLKPPQEMK